MAQMASAPRNDRILLTGCILWTVKVNLMIDWSVVTVDHVREACKLFDGGHINPKRVARSTFLRFNNKVYPAKYVRGLAFHLATGIELNPSSEYSGGLETVRFFQKLGLQASNGADLAKVEPARFPVTIPSVASTARMSGRRYEPQKQALFELLKRRFGAVDCEATFPWLKVPPKDAMDGSLAAILNALELSRGFSNFLGAGRRLQCDFVLPNERIIVEYDERQHFTVQRQQSLEQYPPSLELGFNRHEWIISCGLIKATDSSPPYRDEQRAFYDSLRDIYAARNGYQIVRIRQGVVDWTDDKAEGALMAIISSADIKPPIIVTANAGLEASKLQRIAVIAHDYTVSNGLGLYDYSEHFSRINEICDANACDTILYALYTWDLTSPKSKTHAAMFDGLSNVQRIVLEVGKPPSAFDHVEVWDRRDSFPISVTQKVFKSTDSDECKQSFVQDLRSRRVANGLLVICGESNITSLTRSTGGFRDPFGFTDQLRELDIKVVLNPIHDYMRRYEMREKRKFYSMEGRTVVSVWNKGKGRESELPWTLFHDGKERAEQVREIRRPFVGRPDIRIGIIDLESL